MKTAKVTGIAGIRPWDGQNGTVYYHTLEMDNDEVISLGKKQENAFKVGDEITYETSETPDGKKRYKQVMPNAFGGNGFRGGQQRGSSASFALSYAKDLMIAAMPFHQDVKTSEWVSATVTAAGKFQAWLKENE